MTILRHKYVKRGLAIVVIGVLGLGASLLDQARRGVVPRQFDPPEPTTWKPKGCRSVPFTHPSVLSREGFRNLHADMTNSDEVSIALTPVFREGWTVETELYNATGPVFDRRGNLYFSPLIPHENVVLVSLDPSDGSRRWAIRGTGAPPGASSPMVLADPVDPTQEIIYVALYDRALAVRTDGTVVWDVPTGMTLGAEVIDNFTFGVNYVPSLDAIVALTIDGFVYAVDRQTGAPLLDTPYALPGARTPAPEIEIPDRVMGPSEGIFRRFVNLPPGSLRRLFSIMRANDTEVANMFSVDPHTGRLWIAATAPDEEDGEVDGVSTLGALYRLEIVRKGSAYSISEACHHSFAGGSLSTPSLNPEGTRIYLGDHFGKLLAIDTNCNPVWEVDLGVKIFGTVSVSADNGEIYAPSTAGVFKLVDEGPSGRLVWQAALDVYENLPPGQRTMNLFLTSVGANGLFFQAGSVHWLGGQLVSKLGIGMLDRATGKVRFFIEGGEETIAAVNTGPDGAWYVGNSPLRRIFGKALGISDSQLRGGVTKFEPARLDILVRDATCAAADRASNAHDVEAQCPPSAQADVIQVRELISQARRFGPQAVAAGDLAPAAWNQLEQRLQESDRWLLLNRVDRAASELSKGCFRSVEESSAHA